MKKETETHRMSNLDSYIESNRQRYVDELVELLKFPSVSADSQKSGDMHRCADHLVDHLNAIGLAARKMPTEGHPVVYAEWLGAEGKPTVLIYGHYDVQPADPLELWNSPPFEPVIKEGKLYARGASDDKGQFYAHIKGVEAHLKQNGTLPVNVKFLLEGEEEIASAHLDDFIENNVDLLKADVVIVSDSAMAGPDLPAITYGLRGLAYLEMRVDGPNRDLHSGTYGGSVANPCEMLARMLAKCKDDSGRILIPGFYDDVLTVDPEERAMLGKVPFSVHEDAKSIGIPKHWGEEGYSVLEWRWARPTFEVNGIFGGYMGQGPKTVLPAWAGAKVSMRLVPDQDPDRIAAVFEQYIDSIKPDTVRVTVKRYEGGHPSVVPIEGPFVEAATRAVTRGFGKAPLFTREGGSIPVVSTFKRLLGLNTILIGYGQNDDNLHSPNEKFTLADYQKGILTSAHLFGELAQAQ
jgi:acetylornithine deacetylase/succinyl-diaminopimelate desuccinylase-like protein